MSTVLEKYQAAVQHGEISPDTRQAEVVHLLDTIHEQLENSTSQKNRWFSFKKTTPIKGLYLWGSVGRGKTYLMDLLYDCTRAPKLRQHFFAFMKETQQLLNQKQGQKNPLQKIAADIAKQYKVIFFDEFFVKNIADAVILGELFKALFKHGVILITTSNVAPNDLYKNGIQREQFLPAIEAIKANCTVYELDTSKDYRQRHLDNAGVYYTPLNHRADLNMQRAFSHFTHDASADENPIRIYDREINTVKRADGVIWFDFDALCTPPRCNQDYLAIAKQFHTVLLSNIPVIRASEVGKITLFISLIDIFYDNHVIFAASADTEPDGIYPEGELKFEFERTASRLTEMQSKQYLAFHTGIIQ